MPRVTITVPGKNAQPYRFQLDRQVVTLGRGSENDIAIDCGSVSVKHAEMHRVEGGYELRDLGSTNGTKLDGDRRELIRLRSGLSVKLGDVAFDFLLTDEEREALSHEKPEEEYPIDLPAAAQDAQDPDQNPETEAASGGVFGMALLVLILATAAFFAGMAIRFQKETGDSLIDALKARVESMTAPAKAVPDAIKKPGN